MKQAISGVAPSQLGEVTSMSVWPTITALSTPPFGRLGNTLGKMYSIKAGIGPVFTVGNMLVLMSIPVALQMFFFSLLPGICRRYRLTNRRVIVERRKFSFSSPWVEEMAVALDNFDDIEIVIMPGQDWYPAGDLVFRKGQVETFRLLGVSRPETFRQTCLKAHASFVGVQQAMRAGGAS
ncbi:MAG: hypothetical protein N2C12_06390 [Planctomycetales bacterium]